MAFTLYAYNGNDYANGVATILSNGAPYKMESLEDGGPAEVARLGQSSPDQHGMTDLGFRLQPRVLTLRVLFVDGNDTVEGADNRDWLFSLFRPSRLVYLRLVRDDGTHLILDCYAQQIDIDLVPEHYAASLNRAVITLRAANPLWYSASVKTATFARTTDWATGGTAIPSANVMEYGNYPSGGQAWTYTGSDVNDWSIVIRSGSVAPAAGTSRILAYSAGTGAYTQLANKNARIFSTQGVFYMGTGYAFAGSATMTAGTHNYIQAYDGTVWRNYRSGTVLEAEVEQAIELLGSSRKWRGDDEVQTTTHWPEEFPYYAIYNIELDAAQRVALDDAINADIAGANSGTITTVNLGDVDERPQITIRGPISDPVLTNLATDDVIDLTGISVASNTTLTVDLRDGDKTVTNIGGTSFLGDMGTPVQLASFALAPAPIATGGTNLISITGGSITADTLITVTYYDRYVSF